MTRKITPKRPYLLRAYYDWLIENSFTPYLVVNAHYPNVVVPTQYVKDGQIVLNLSMQATGNFQLSNETIVFNARFNGKIEDIYIPMGAVLAVYARENGDGIMFEHEAVYDISNIEEQSTFQKTGRPQSTYQNEKQGRHREKQKPHLRVIK